MIRLPRVSIGIRTVLPVVLLLPLSAPAHAEFDIDAYRAHLEEAADLSYSGLIEQFPPTEYIAQVPRRAAAPAFYPQIDNWLHLTDGELGLLQRHDFVVSERWRQPAFGDAFEAIWHKDLPAFVSTDAILHAVHQSYDAILMRVETEYFIPILEEALRDLYDAWPVLAGRYEGVPGMEESLEDLDVYVTVARSLLSAPRPGPPSQAGNQPFVNQVLDMIAAEYPRLVQLFNDAERVYDFSQFKPRGHYAGDFVDPGLGRLPSYFRTMMWLGRTEFRLTPPPPMPGDPPIDVTREIIDAHLMLELIEESGVAGKLGEIDRTLQMLVGSPDNVTIDHLRDMTRDLGIESASALLDPATMATFRAHLQTDQSNQTLILSQVVTFPPHEQPPEDVEIPMAFLTMGQRFLLDSFITGQVVFPFVNRDLFEPRMLPDPLDALFALGNDAGLQFLRRDIEEYGYAPNLSALRYVMDHTGPDELDGSLYQVWLQAIRTLGRTGEQRGAPQFMRTGAWQQQKMNTQLAGWAELRHDNLLYGKPSYTGNYPVCSFPCTYVEPVPEFYALLKRFAEVAQGTFAQVPELRWDVGRFFEKMSDTMERLQVIAEKELNGAPFTDDEKSFLSSVIYKTELTDGGCSEATRHDGWYGQLYFTTFIGENRHDDRSGGSVPDALVADIHTNPNEPFYEVIHLATGDPEMAVIVANASGRGPTAFIGPVATAHEYITHNFERLTDEEWRAIYDGDHPSRPDWTYAYLADRQGNLRMTGPRLIEETDEGTPWEWALADTFTSPSDSEFEVPAADTEGDESGDPTGGDGSAGSEEDLNPWPPAGPWDAGDLPFVAVAPNPLRDEAMVSFRFPKTQRGGVLQVEVFDSRGGRVRELYRGNVPGALTHLRWDGRDGNGARVAAGVYYMRLGTELATHTYKITVVR